MPGSIQSVERAAAILHGLADSPVPMRLADVSALLGLSRSTAHGLLRTLCDVGFVEQERDSGRYHLSSRLGDLRPPRLDGNELRARGMNWADPLAARTGEAVRIGVPDGEEVLVVHYVFRPDPAPQQADVGARLPRHATALGKMLLAYDSDPRAVARLPSLTAYTTRTVTDPVRLGAQLSRSRQQGYAVEYGEHRAGQASIAAPILESGGRVVGAVAVHGDLDRLCDTTGAARVRTAAHVMDCARAISRELATSRSA